MSKARNQRLKQKRALAKAARKLIQAMTPEQIDELERLLAKKNPDAKA